MAPKPIAPVRRFSMPSWALGPGVGLLALLWVQWPTLADVAGQWASDPRYSHGYLVPLFAAVLLWLRRKSAPALPLRPSWWGLPVLAAGLALRFAGTYYYLPWFDAVSLLPCLAGLCLLTGGWRALRWAWPAVAFLFFMLPLPHGLAGALSHPLQRMATVAGTYVLQTLGFVAFAHGNVIRLGDMPLGVAEACSGLSMLLIFFALAAAVVLLCRRSPLEKAILFLSAVPIALLSNLTRIVVTGVLYRTAGRELGDLVFHDLAGWLMMPLGLALLWLELRTLDWLFPLRRERSLSLPGLPPLARQQAPRPATPPGRKAARGEPAPAPL